MDTETGFQASTLGLSEASPHSQYCSEHPPHGPCLLQDKGVREGGSRDKASRGGRWPIHLASRLLSTLSPGSPFSTPAFPSSSTHCCLPEPPEQSPSPLNPAGQAPVKPHRASENRWVLPQTCCPCVSGPHIHSGGNVAQRLMRVERYASLFVLSERMNFPCSSQCCPNSCTDLATVARTLLTQSKS